MLQVILFMNHMTGKIRGKVRQDEQAYNTDLNFKLIHTLYMVRRRIRKVTCY